MAEDAEGGEVWEEAVDVAILTEEANECMKDTAAVTGRKFMAVLPFVFLTHLFLEQLNLS